MPSENDKTPTQSGTTPVENISVGSTRYGSRSGSSLSQVQVDTGKLSRRGTRNALIFIALGLLSFAFPLIEFDPPMQGQKYWSVLDVSRRPQIETGKNNSMGGSFDFGATFASMMVLPFEWVYVFYGTLIVAAGAVLVFPFRKLLVGISLTGVVLLVVPFRGVLGMLRVLQTSAFQSNRGGDLRMVWILFGIEFAILAVVGWTDTGLP
jgi:hypothetical protein